MKLLLYLSDFIVPVTSFCGSWSRWKPEPPRRSCNVIVTVFSRIFLQGLQ